MVEARTPTRSERTKKRSGAATVKAALWALAPRRLREWKRRRMTARALWQAMEGLTLNGVGPIYCVKRLPGEPNKNYKRRICKAARTIDTVNVSGWKPLQAAKPDAGRSAPPPASGEKLDEIARKHKLRRRRGESDAQLIGRIRAVVLEELEGARKK